VGLAVAAMSMAFDLRPLLATSNAFCLVWFWIMNIDTLRLNDEQRFASPVVLLGGP
jgi:hypothetical protein